MSADLTQGPVRSHLQKLTLPMVWGLLAIIGFNVTDTFFVAQLGTQELAAISFTFPVVSLLSSFALGLGAGATSVISRAIGEKSFQKVKRLTTDSLVLSFLIVLVLCVVGIVTIDPLFRSLGATDDLMPLIKEYMFIWYFGMAFLVIPMVGNGAIRASGDTKIPSFIMVLAAIVNGLLDPLLIFGWGPISGMGMQGAALATVFARATTFIAALWILHFKKQMLTAKPPADYRDLFESWWSILYVGIPAAINNGLNPILQGALTRLVAVYGPAAVAGFGVATRIEMLSMIVILAMTAAAPPFVGQNWGANQIKRIQTLKNVIIRFSVVHGLALALLLYIFAEPLTSLFDSDPEVIASASLYLSLVPITYVLVSPVMIFGSAFNALNRPLLASLIAGSRVFLFILPLAVLGSWLWRLEGIYLAVAFGNLLAGVLAIYLFSNFLRQRRAESSG